MAKDKSAQGDKPKKRSRVKETFAELKKVTWPTFGKTMKQTGAVLLVTVFFLVILLIMDQLLGLAHRQLIKGLPSAGTLTQIVNAFTYGFKSVTNALFKGASSVPLLI